MVRMNAYLSIRKENNFFGRIVLVELMIQIIINEVLIQKNEILNNNIMNC